MRTVVAPTAVVIGASRRLARRPCEALPTASNRLSWILLRQP